MPRKMILSEKYRIYKDTEISLANIGGILHIVRKTVNLSQIQIAKKLNVGRSLYDACEKENPNEYFLTSVRFNHPYESVFGVDLYQSALQKKMIISNPGKLSWEHLLVLMGLGAELQMIPVFEKGWSAGGLTFKPFSPALQPAFFMFPYLDPRATFVIVAEKTQNNLKIDQGDHLFCSKELSAEEIIQGRIHLVCTREKNIITNQLFQPGLANSGMSVIQTPVAEEIDPINILAVHKITSLAKSFGHS